MSRFSIYICFFFLADYGYAQISWNLSAEAGYFKTSGEDVLFKDDLLTRVNGQLELLYAKSSHEASLLLNVHPEYLGSKNRTGLLKINANGNYFNYSDNFTLGINFSIMKNNYFGDIINVKYDIFNFHPSLVTSLLGKPLSTMLGYTSQKIEYSGNIIYDLIYSESEFLFLNDRYFNSGAGFYIEKFNIENEYNHYLVRKLKNEGWRAGPLINFKYIRNFIINSSYRLLMHFSNSVDAPSYEHQITFLAGKVFFEKYSLFVLADFYIRDFRLKQPRPQDELLYSPVNQENKYFLKLAYEINQHSDLFLRVGYSKENVDYITGNLAGWSFTLGLDLK